MIKVDFKNKTYTCPFCEYEQSYKIDNNYEDGTCMVDEVGFYKEYISGSQPKIPFNYLDTEMKVYSFECNSRECGKICVVAINKTSGKQIDIFPEATFKNYPDYIPSEIRSDYEEASMIIEKSPKASVTLLRRCLQGMIRKVWKIEDKKTLYEEIKELEGKVTTLQWNAINSVRIIGNIGAHMEKDNDLIININYDEAKELKKLIEMLLDNWYVVRYEEEQACKNIIEISKEKQKQKNKLGGYHDERNQTTN